LIFWPNELEIPADLENNKFVFIKSTNPHLSYCQFFQENKISNVPKVPDDLEFKNGSYISSSAIIGEDTVIFPQVFISNQVCIGSHCYIGSGVKIIGRVFIGDNVIIRENSVIGADGLTTDKDMLGNIIKMPQFGGVRIEDDVTIGAGTIIARGAIDDTVIGKQTSIDNSVFISHNVSIGKRALIVGETIMFGSSTLGDDSFISGNSTIRNGVSIGNNSLIGMGSVVVNDIGNSVIVKGNPAK